MIEVNQKTKDAYLKDNAYRKNLIIEFPNGEFESFGNEHILLDSFTFRESLCSQTELKFGLGEASELSFTGIDIPNIKGCYVDASIQITENGIPVEDVEDIYLGRFKIKECRKEQGTPLREVLGYTTGLTDELMKINPVEKWKLMDMFNMTTFNYGLSFDDFLAIYLNQEEDLKWNDVTNQLYEEFETNKKMHFNFKIDDSDGNVCYAVVTVKRFSDYQLEPKGNTYNKSYFDSTLLCKLVGTKTNQFDEIQKLMEVGVPKYPEHQTAKNVFPNKTWKNMRYLKPMLAQETGTIGYGEAFRTGINVDFDKVIYPYNPSVYSNYTTKNQTGFYEFYIPVRVDLCSDSSGNNIYKTYNLYTNVGVYEAENAGGGLVTTNATKISVNVKRQDSPKKTNFYRASETVIKEFEPSKLINGYLESNAKFVINGRPNPQIVDINKAIQGCIISPQTIISPRLIIGKGKYMPVTNAIYSDADFEEYNVQKIGYVRVEYKASDNQNYSITVNLENGNDNLYEIKDNKFFTGVVWTADKVKEWILTWFKPHISNIYYTPCELTMLGCPFLQAGDVISLQTDSGPKKIIIMQRTLQGSQLLIDDISCQGSEYNPNRELYVIVDTEMEV